MKRAGIALGSNLGDKNSLIVKARDHLAQMALSDDPFCSPPCTQQALWDAPTAPMIT